MRLRYVAVLCALATAVPAGAAENQPQVKSKAALAAAPAPKLPPAPDLVLVLKEYPQTGSPHMVYPYTQFWVENRGTAASAATSVEVKCTRYKGNENKGDCSAAGKFTVPALAAAATPNDPAPKFKPTIGFTPGPMSCDKWSETNHAWVGITTCVIVGEVEPVAHELFKTNNKVTITIQAY